MHRAASTEFNYWRLKIKCGLGCGLFYNLPTDNYFSAGKNNVSREKNTEISHATK